MPHRTSSAGSRRRQALGGLSSVTSACSISMRRSPTCASFSTAPLLSARICNARPYSDAEALVQPQLRDMPRIRLQFAALHLRDKVRQHCVGAAGNSDLLALAHDEAVEEIDLGAPALLHV